VLPVTRRRAPPTVDGMQPISFTLRFDGEVVTLDGGRLWAESRATAGIAEVLCRRELDVAEDGSLAEPGGRSFGDDSVITVRACGRVGASPDPAMRHGTAVLEIT